MKTAVENEMIANGILTSQDFENPMLNPATMTMQDIVNTAISLGFNAKQWSNCNRYAWNHSLENAACDYLQKYYPEILNGDCGESENE